MATGPAAVGCVGNAGYGTLPHAFGQLTLDNAEWVGAMLLAENRRSVDGCYDEYHIEDLYTHG